jgi:hypothetical protein
VKRNDVRVEGQPRLSLYGTLGLVIVARWIAMVVVIIVGASAGKQARILIRCPDLSGLYLEDKIPITSGVTGSVFQKT